MAYDPGHSGNSPDVLSRRRGPHERNVAPFASVSGVQVSLDSITVAHDRGFPQLESSRMRASQELYRIPVADEPQQ